MLKIGLTGNIGSGKSLVCSVFEKLGLPVYYADLEARKLLDSEVLRSKLIQTFGEEIEDKALNKIDRSKLASLVFTDKIALEKLNALIHPLLRADFKSWCTKHEKRSYILQEAAILFENGFADLFDKTIVVAAPKKIRLKRVMQRDSVSKEDVLSRMNNQWTDEKKEAAADFIIINDGIELILPQILRLHQSFS